jgi:hypothetical protein
MKSDGSAELVSVLASLSLLRLRSTFEEEELTLSVLRYEWLCFLGSCLPSLCM